MRKILSVFLAVLFCFMLTAVVFPAAAADGETFVFGAYPQSLVTDSGLISRLTRAYKFDDKPVRLDGSLYVMFEVPAKCKPGDAHFAVAHGYKIGEPYWFRCEAIRWRVLEKNDEGMLLFADRVLDARPYNTVKTDSVTWETSSIRAWLNSSFIDLAFDAAEQAYILTSDTPNADNPVHGSYNGKASAYAGDFLGGYPYQGTEGGNDTTDKVFLPSFDEITDKSLGFNKDCNKYGDFGQFVGYYETDPARRATASAYAKCRGAWANYDETTGVSETVRYWLRTPGYEAGYAAAVLEDGRVSTGWEVDYDIVGIRPMLRVAANAVSSDHDVGEDDPVVNPVDPYAVKIIAPEGSIRYREKGLQLKADQDVTWTSSDPSIASVDENGNVTVTGVGTVYITATPKDSSNGAKPSTAKLEISYAWWQILIRIFLLGFLWY